MVALVAVVPLVAWFAAERRAGRVRTAVGLDPPKRRARVLVPAGVVVAIACLALAATQPVLASRTNSTVRRDADLFVVLDTSRSMLAAPSAAGPTRFDRARSLARELASSLPAFDVGLASLTDRALPHLFPTGSRADFDATLDEAIGIDRPPPVAAEGRLTLVRATSLATLSDLGEAHFFATSAKERVAVVLTDGETRPFDPRSVARALEQAHVHIVFVHVWGPRERVWLALGKPAPDYRPDSASDVALAQLAEALGGEAFSERDLGRIVADVRRFAGRRRSATSREAASSFQLAPLSAAAALLPLGLVFWRRNI